MALEEAGCMREWAPENEQLYWDGVQAVLAMEIREQAGAASDNSRKDNKGEGSSCEFPQEKKCSSIHRYTVGLIWPTCTPP